MVFSMTASRNQYQIMNIPCLLYEIFFYLNAAEGQGLKDRCISNVVWIKILPLLSISVLQVKSAKAVTAVIRKTKLVEVHQGMKQKNLLGGGKRRFESISAVLISKIR